MEVPVVKAEYNQGITMENDFKKIKSSHLEILKELRREYEVLKNADLGSAIIPNRKKPF